MLKNVLSLMVGVLVLMGVYAAVRPYLEPLSIERVRAAFEEEDFIVTEFSETGTPLRESVESWTFKLGEYRVEVMRYDDEGIVAKQAGYMSDDPGSAMVENMNIAQSIGTVAKPSSYSASARKGKWICYVLGPEKGVCQSIVKVFRGA